MNLRSQKEPNPAGRREREKARRRQEILSAAGRVFAVHGFEAATIEQIARQSEYATGTIYLYFKDKHALYTALIASQLSDMVDAVEKAARQATPADPASRLRHAIRAQFEFHDRNREFVEVLMRHRKGPPLSGTPDWKVIGQTFRRHQAVLVGLIAQLQRRKIIRKGDPQDYTTALVGMMFHLTREAMKDTRQPLAAKTDFVYQLFMAGAQRA